MGVGFTPSRVGIVFGAEVLILFFGLYKMLESDGALHQ